VRLKLDENLPYQLVEVLIDLGHDVDTVPDEHLAGRDDHAVWAAAQAARRFLVTQDLDFSDARKCAPGTHHGLLLVRLPQHGRQALAERISIATRRRTTSSPAFRLRSACRMKCRPCRSPSSPVPPSSRRSVTHEIALARRSAYRMTHGSRTAYEHHIPPVVDLRYSLTFRTLR
jgi:predicted nuclease of predicted toxin-antitoxin system